MNKFDTEYLRICEEYQLNEFNKIKDVKEYARKEGFAKISLIAITPKQKEKEYIL